MIVWPPTNSPRHDEIPVFVRFTPTEFSADITLRSKPINQFWDTDYSIMLPMPNTIGTYTSMKYSSDLQAVSNAQHDIRRTVQKDTEYVLGTGGLRSPRGMIKNNDNTLSPADLIPFSGAGDSEASINENYLDMVDTTWMGMNRRKYRFNFLLICKSISESETAVNISNRFNLLSLSIMSTSALNGKIPSGMSRSLHPPMWSISAGVDNSSAELTKAWIGAYPQLSVLSEVKTFKIGGEDINSIQGMKKDGVFLPLQYTIQLEFTEIEPVYQSEDNNTTKSRSQFFE